MTMFSPLRSPLSLPLSAVMGAIRRGVGVLSALFGPGNVPGLWYAPSSLASEFQDSAGTTAAAIGSPVGKINDKSGNGLNASQATSTARAVLSARVNLLTKTEQLSDAAWLTNGNVAKGAAVADPNGGMSAITVTATAANGDLYQSVGNSGPSFTNSVWLRRRSGAGAVQLSSPANVNSTVTLTSDWQRFTSSGASAGAGASNAFLVIRIVTVGDAIDVAFPQTETGSIATRYQRVNTATDYDSAGFPVYQTLDGVDDGFGTATFAAGTLTSNMDCFVAIRRNAATRLVLAFPAAGTFFGYVDPGNASSTYSGCGTPTIAVNGTSVAGGTAATAGALATALGVGQWAILEVRNLDLSAWTAVQIGNYPAYVSNVALGPIVLCPAQDDATRTKIRAALAAEYGVTLP